MACRPACGPRACRRANLMADNGRSGIYTLAGFVRRVIALQTTDGDTVENCLDKCLGISNSNQLDLGWRRRGDGVRSRRGWGRRSSMSWTVAHAIQIGRWSDKRSDGDGRPDACDFDTDGDCLPNTADLCPSMRPAATFSGGGASRACADPCRVNFRPGALEIGNVPASFVVDGIVRATSNLSKSPSAPYA
jgi:hypothetical protein